MIVRLANGAVMQVSITNTGGDHGYAQGTPVMVQVPPDALRVLAPSPGDAGAAPEAVSDPGAGQPVAAGVAH